MTGMQKNIIIYQMIKPFLKWAGGKRQLLSEIKKYIPKDFQNYTYYEPFAGAGAVFFGLQPEKAVINDSNEQLINAYNAIKNSVSELVQLLKNYEKNNDKNFYYNIRDLDRDPESFRRLSNTEKAARFIYLNKTCYNGLYRVNSKGFFNVPYGKYDNPAICEEKVLYQISGYLNSNMIGISCGDFEDAVSPLLKQSAEKNSFVYFDPPYHSEGNKNFTSYQADGFDESQQERLCDLIIKLTKNKIKCLLSNSDTDFIRELYLHRSFQCDKNFFEIITVQAKRAINSKASGRGIVNEILVKNWKD